MPDKPEEQASKKPDAKVSRLSWWLAGGKPVKPDAKCLQVDKLQRWRRKSDRTDDGETRPFWQEAGYVLSDGKRMSGRRTSSRRTPTESNGRSSAGAEQSQGIEQDEEDAEDDTEEDHNDAETTAESEDDADDGEESSGKAAPVEGTDNGEATTANPAPEDDANDDSDDEEGQANAGKTVLGKETK